jgi:predicted HD phosphohydrolase
MANVSYTRMADMTEADLQLINADADEDARELPSRLMDAVAGLERFQGALKVNRLEHSLQSATRAHRAGKDKEYVVAALLHDIGDALAPHSHGDMVAAVLRPFVSDRVCWIVQKHALFQAYYYAHLMGEDRNARDPSTTHCRSSSSGPWWKRSLDTPATPRTTCRSSRPRGRGSSRTSPCARPCRRLRRSTGRSRGLRFARPRRLSR